MDGDNGDDGKHVFTWVGWEECEGEWLGQSWRNEAGSWFQRQGDAYGNERFLILSEEDEGGRVTVTTDKEEWIQPWGWTYADRQINDRN